MKLLSHVLNAIKPVLDMLDHIIWARRTRTLLMDYRTRENQPLLEMLNRLLTQYGFEPAPAEEDSRPDFAIWHKRLAPTLRARMSITLHPAVAPDTWSLSPMVSIDASYVAHVESALAAGRDLDALTAQGFNPAHPPIMRFEPAHLRWQDRLELQSPALKGRPETIEELRKDLVDVCEHYVLPVLEECRDPLAAARFLERAETELRSRRLRHDEPRYKVFNPASAPALLFDEAGETARAFAFLEARREKLSQLWATEDPDWTGPRLAKIDKLLDYLRSSLPAEQVRA